MLVLSRQRDETIMIGDDIEITVVDVRGDKVRLGINAPSRIAVHRKEVYEAIRAENERAALVDGDDLTELSRTALGRVRTGQARSEELNRSARLVQTQPPRSKTQRRA
ncbi:MAG: carbon storage regulator CsrA [Phycisphaerales bacterium]